VNLVANVAHDSIDLVLIKFNTSFVQRHLSWTFAWMDFFVAPISLQVSTERAMQLLRSELQLPSAWRHRPSDSRPRLRPCDSWLVRHTTVRGRGCQPDARFYGTWVGVETYEIPRTVTRYFYHRGEAPVKKSAVVVIGDSGQTLTFDQGLLQGRVEISPKWGNNSLDFSVRTSTSRRTRGILKLSADGNTLTETGFALVPGTPFPLACNISGTFHRQGKK
jgi:hypothetical protein